MIHIGRFNELEVERIVSVGVFLRSDDGEEVLLPRKYVKPGVKPGDLLSVFIYTDSEDRPVAVTTVPLAVVGEFAVLACKATADFGAFLDWGLEKDLFVPVREELEPMEEGKKYVVKVCYDPRNKRVFATSKIGKFLDKADEKLAEGNEATLLFYSKSELGWSVIINNTYAGLVYVDEVFENVAVGDTKRGWIKKIREDGKIDAALRKPGFDGVLDSRGVIVEALKAAGGFIPCGDHTPPEEIMKLFSMSKKTYKRAAGTLFKARIISIDEDGIRLLAAESRDHEAAERR
jgi:uncharacterized protein